MSSSLGHVDYGAFTIRYTVNDNINRLIINPAYGYCTTGANTFNITTAIFSGAYSIFNKDYINAIVSFTSISNSSQIYGNSNVEYYL